MNSLHQSKIRYKGVTLQQFMDLLIDNYQITPEEQTDVKKFIKAPWDPNQHIEALYDSQKTNLESLEKSEKRCTIPTRRIHQSRIYGNLSVETVHESM